MNQRKETFVSKVLVSTAIITSILHFGSVKPAYAEDAASERIYGNDRYETSVAVARKGWPDKSDYVILCRGDSFPDALCAAPLAKLYNAPILLTEKDALNPKVKEEIESLSVKKVIIAGGTGAVSQDVTEDLHQIPGVQVERIEGKDRYETSAKIAERIGNANGAFLAVGSSYADALAVSPIAAALKMPVLLTDTKQVPASVEKYVTSINGTTYIIGGNHVISEEIAQKIPSAKRIQGADRYETNIAVLNTFKDKINFNTVYLSIGQGNKGNEFADALVGAALAAQTSSPLILTDKEMPKSVEEFIKKNVPAKAHLTVLGGTGVLPDAVVQSAASLKGAENQESSLPTDEKPQDPVENPDDVENPATNNGGGNTPSSGDNTSNSSENILLKQVSTQISAVIPLAKTQKEKDILLQIKAAIDNVIANPSYNYNADVSSVLSKIGNLSASELLDLYSLKAQFNEQTIDTLRAMFGI